jgi:hypothetical protein
MSRTEFVNSRAHTLDILRHNGYSGISTYRMAQLQDQPDASIRRNIQELRLMGHHIVYADGVMRYVCQDVAAGQVVEGTEVQLSQL